LERSVREGDQILRDPYDGGNELVRNFHDKIPVILQEKDEERWLNPENDFDELLPRLSPCPSDKMEAYPSSGTSIPQKMIFRNACSRSNRVSTKPKREVNPRRSRFMELKRVLFKVQNGVAHITLNRPEAANTINEGMGKDLMEAVTHCYDDPTIRAVLISGAGSLFSGGGDLKAFASAGQRLPSLVREVTTYLHAAISRLTRMNAPVVAAIHGAAAGAGLSLAMACDIVIAAESSRFTVAYTQAGLTPDGGLTYFLPRMVGIRRALELTLTNRIFSAKEAAEWGIVTQVVPDKELLQEAMTLASRLAAGPTEAFGVSKRLLHSGGSETLETQMESESQGLAKSAGSEDATEGIRAFLEKRSPRFR
jgi:2-(1,2-epoxy-1,2-dihydrophenyl)acetyl-CoA isomerase